jgi:hypothetical protein
MQKFELILRNDKQKFYDRFAIFIFILNGIGICVAHLNPRLEIIDKSGKIFFIGLAVTLVSSQIIMLFTNLVTRHLNSFLTASFIISLYWTLLGYWWFGIVSFVLILLYVLSKRNLKVDVDVEKILYPSFPVKVIKWNDLNSLVLKDGLLTIDFKNNKLIQQIVDKKSDVINEKEFNEFCRQQLKVKEVK